MLEHGKPSSQDLKKVHTFIKNLNENNKEIINETFQQRNIPSFFNDLHIHLSIKNLVQKKKYDQIDFGVYILLIGQLSFSCEYKDLSGTKYSKMNTKDKFYKRTVWEPFSVIECEHNKCLIQEDSVLLFIPDKLCLDSSFYELKNKRKDLYYHHFLSTDHGLLWNLKHYQHIIDIDTNFHHLFSFQTYNYRSLIKLPTAALVNNGRVALSKRYGINNPILFGKYGLMMPEVQYEAHSAQVEIMMIKCDGNEVMKDLVPRKHQLSSNGCPQVQQSKHRIYNNKSDYVFTLSTKSKKEDLKRYKQVLKLGKKHEKYSILSTHVCKNNLNFAKNFNEMRRTTLQQKTLNPLVLFDCNSTSKKGSMPFLKDHNKPSKTLTQKPSIPIKTLSGKQKLFNCLKSTKLSSGKRNIDLLTVKMQMWGESRLRPRPSEKYHKEHLSTQLFNNNCKTAWDNRCVTHQQKQEQEQGK